MLGTFICARLANIYAQATKRLGEFTVPGYITGRDAANLRAIHVQLYATRHAFNVLFLQAGNSAVVALSGAGITSVDARLKFFMRHIDLQRTYGVIIKWLRYAMPLA